MSISRESIMRHYGITRNEAFMIAKEPEVALAARLRGDRDD